MLAEILLIDLLEYSFVALGGLIFMIAVAHWWRQGGDPLRGSPLRANRLGLIHIWFVLCAYPLGLLLGFYLAEWLSPAHLASERLQFRQQMLAGNIVPFFLSVLCMVIGWVSFTGGWRGFGLGRRSFRAVLAYSLVGWLLSLFLVGLVFQVTDIVFELLYDHLPEHAVFTTLQDPEASAWLKWLSIFGALILAPVGEELFFRGILQTAFQKTIPPKPGSMRHRWLAVLITAVLFGMMHFNVPQHVPPLIVFGFILGFLYEKTGSLYVPVLVHVLFNGKSLLWYQLHTGMMTQ